MSTVTAATRLDTGTGPLEGNMVSPEVNTANITRRKGWSLTGKFGFTKVNITRRKGWSLTGKCSLVSESYYIHYSESGQVKGYDQQLLSIYIINTPRPFLPSFLSSQKLKVKKA